MLLRGGLLLATVLTAVAATTNTCPAFQDWRAWTGCVWFPLNKLVDDLVDACDIRIDKSKLHNMPPLPNMPDKCGHCSPKVRCRKRAEVDGCFPIEVEHQACDEHGDVCTMPVIAEHGLGCNYEFAGEYLRQCSNRADYPEWESDGSRKLASFFPQFHCVEKDGQCKCCCHPYHPTADGSSCHSHGEEQCQPYSEWNSYSNECVWLPPSAMRRVYQEHCDFEVPVSDKAKAIYDKFETMPDGSPLPERCGYCSYKIKCRKRDRNSRDGKPECFPLDVEKRNCGPDDGAGYGDVCDLPKILGGCNFTEQLHKMAGAGADSRMKKMPMGIRMGLMKMASLMPHARCIEKDDRCKCCCHPYKPNADATACLLNDVCKDAHDLGIEYDMNLGSSFWWF